MDGKKLERILNLGAISVASLAGSLIVVAAASFVTTFGAGVVLAAVGAGSIWGVIAGTQTLRRPQNPGKKNLSCSTFGEPKP
jgi:hypothetical protein